LERFLPDYQNLYELHERLNDDFFSAAAKFHLHAFRRVKCGRVHKPCVRKVRR
jgi:hypothetical protein